MSPRTAPANESETRDQIPRVDSAHEALPPRSPRSSRAGPRRFARRRRRRTRRRTSRCVRTSRTSRRSRRRTNGQRSGRGVVRRECVSLIVCFRMTSFVDDEPSTRRSSRAQNSLPAVRLSFDPMRPSIPFFFFFPALATSPPGESPGPVDAKSSAATPSTPAFHSAAAAPPAAPPVGAPPLPRAPPPPREAPP